MSSEPINSTQSNPNETGVYNIPIQVASSLEPQRASLDATLLAAQKRLKDFALNHNWHACLNEPFAKRFQVYAEKASFDRNLLEICGLDTTIELPKTYCAALEQDVLLCVSPELYRTLYPEGDEPGAFEKLLTHEMAHRLHIRILNGDEEAMGPIWFYEGFALYAASQFEQTAPHLNDAGIWEIVNAQERGDYRQYAALFRHFLNKAPIQQLIEMAGKTEFVNWLQEISS